MAGITTTKLSSKGQVVIPENIRTKLHLKPGAQFVVLGEKDVVILKNISSPRITEFDGLIAKARKSARNAGIKKKTLKMQSKKSGLKNEDCLGYQCFNIRYFLFRATLSDFKSMAGR